MTCRGLGSRPAAIGAACRTAFVLLLSWLGLPICGGAQVRTPESAGPGSVRDAELRRDIAEVMRRLDAAFDKGDAVAYLAAFEPDHPGVHALLAQRLRRLFPAGLPARGDSQNTLRRTSTILGDPRRVGPRTVVRVRHEVHAEGRPLAVAVEDSMIAFRTDGGSPVPTFVTEAPRSIDCPPADLFRCPPCNFEVGGVPGWLCVPMGRDRAQSLEASSFYLLGTDHACDVSVRIDGRRRPATAVVEQLAELLRQVEPDAEAGLATAWLPETLAKTDNPELSGARIEVDLPGVADAEGGGLALFHVVQLGALQHLLLVRGGRKTIARNRAALDDLLASFHVLDENAERATAAARALMFHAGGVIDGRTYDNTKFGVTMTGPADWKVEQRCGGAAFRVVWVAPSGARLWLTGWTVPPGMAYWCEETADRWVRELCAETGLVPDEEPGTDETARWRPDGTCEASVRTFPCSMTRGRDGGDITAGDLAAKAKRTLRVAFREDLLLVADGMTTSDDDRRAVTAAFATLRL